MSYELSYDTYVTGVSSDELESRIRECKEWLERIETEIFALILSDPAKVRNQRRRRRKDDEPIDDDDYSWMDNPQYLTKRWEELKQDWDETHCRLTKYEDALYAVERKTREVDVCPDCMRELEWIREEKPSDGGYCHTRLTCPVCRKVYAAHPTEAEGENARPMPKTVVVRTFTEG